MVVLALALALAMLAVSASAPNARASWTLGWNDETSMGALVSQAAVVGSPEGIIYVMGGVGDLSYVPMSTAYSYDTETGSWAALDTMPAATRGAAAAMGQDGRVYVFAGTAVFTQIYDPGVDLWTLGETMPYPAWEAKAATVANGSICVIGGEDAQPGGMQIYDPSTDSWSIGPPVPEAVLCGALVAVGDDLYYSGGGVSSYTGTDNMFKYDSALGEWVTLSAMPGAVAGHSMVVGIDGLLYVVGGAESGYNTPMDAYSVVYAYDPVADEWSTAVSMGYERTYLGAATTSDGRIWALGGNTPTEVVNVVESLQLYTFDYTIELSSPSVRAGESVLLIADAEFTYIEENWHELRWALVSAADDTQYASEYVWCSNSAPIAATIEVSSAVPAGDYLVVILYWYSYSDDAYELIEGVTLDLEVLPAAEPADVLIAELEAQIADLQAQIDDLSDDLNATETDLMAEISALDAQVAALQDALDALETSSSEDNAALMDEIAALQDEVTALKNALNETANDVGDVQTSVDDKLSATMGYAIIGLLVVVIILLIVMMVMGRKSPPPPAP